MSVMEERPARTRRSFTDEFKRDAVAMVLDDANKLEGWVPSRWQVSTSAFPDLRGLYVDGGPASSWVCSQLVRCRAAEGCRLGRCAGPRAQSNDRKEAPH